MYHYKRCDRSARACTHPSFHFLWVIIIMWLNCGFFFHSILPFTETSQPINKGISFHFFQLVWGFGKMALGLDSIKWGLDCLFYHIYRRTRCCIPVWVIFQSVACRRGNWFRALQPNRHPAIFFLPANLEPLGDLQGEVVLNMLLLCHSAGLWTYHTCLNLCF